MSESLLHTDNDAALQPRVRDFLTVEDDPFLLSRARTEEQCDFFKDAFKEAADMEHTGKELLGPNHKSFASFLEEVDYAVRRINPNFTAEHLKPSDYQSMEVQRELNHVDYETNRDLMRLRSARTAGLNNLGLEMSKAENPETFPFAFDVPEYCRQGDGYTAFAIQGCFNPCFRMVFNGITGEKVEEKAVVLALRSTYDSHLADDEEFLKVFNTPTFKEKYGTDVRLLTIFGASLTTLAKINNRMKEKQPDSKIFCIVNLQTESSTEPDIWHNNVLMGADEESVICHDPSLTHGDEEKECRAIPKEDFYRRWGLTFNRAHILIANSDDA